MQQQTLQATEFFKLKANFKDGGGNPGAGYRNGVTWVGPSCVQLLPDPDFLQADGVTPDDAHRLVRGVSPGTGQIIVTTDGGVGATAQPVHGTFTVTVSAGLVVTIDFDASANQPQ